MPKCKLDIQKGIVEAAIKLVATPTIKDKGNSTLFINNTDYTKQQAYKIAVSVTTKINKAFGEDVAFREQKTDGQEIKIIPSEQLVQNYFTAYNNKWNVGHRAIYGINQFGDSDIAYKRDEMPTSITEANLDNNTAIANELAQTISTNIGFDYASISPEEAVEVTKNASNPWKGEAAFFNGSTVYFVSKELTEKTVLHEFSHPLLRAISKQNPDLFNHLYIKTSLNNPEGNIIAVEMQNLYSDLDTSSALYKEEFLVRALTRAATKESSQGFLQVVKDILYQIKQMLRKVFGQNVDVSKLDTNTTLNELAIMLKGDHFKIDRTQITQEDINAYIRDQSKEIADIKALDEKARTLLSNDMLKAANAQLKSLKTVKQYEDMLKAIEDSSGRNKLRDIVRNLTDYRDLTDADIAGLAENLDWANAQAQDLVSSMFRLRDVSHSMLDHMKQINKSPEDKNNLQKVSYYLGVINYWLPFINKADNLLRKELPSTSAARVLLNTVNKDLADAKKEALEIQTKGTIDALRTTLQPTADGVDKLYKENIAKIKSRNAGPELEKTLLANENKWYDTARLNPYINAQGDRVDPIKQYLLGERGDAGALGSLIEGIISNPDPIIGGFGLAIKKALTDVSVSLQAKQNDFIQEISPLAKKVGYNPDNIAKLGSEITFLDKIGTTDDGKFVEKEEFTYLNPFKNTEFHIKRMYFELKEAQSQANLTKSEEDYTKVAEINRAIAKHKELYWHQENQSEFYAEDYIFDTPIGKEADLDKQLILAKIRDLQNTTDDEYTNQETADQLKEAWQEYQQLHAVLDEYGNKKTGKALEKAILLKKYREHTRQFYKWIEYPGAFQSALNNYEQRLVNEGSVKGSEDFNQKRKAWIDENTVVKITDGYYALTQLIYERIKELKQSLPKDEEVSADIDQAWSDIRESLIGYRDEDNQPNASEMTPERIAMVKTRQLDIIKFQNQLAKTSGLTPEEMREMSAIFEQIKAGEPNPNRQRLTELMGKKTKSGLSPLIKAQLAALYAKLNELQSKTATDYYTNIVNNYLSTDELKGVQDLFLNTQSRTITNDTADRLLEDNIITPLLEASPAFKDWFEKNHIKKKIFDYEAKEEKEVWERLYVWNITKPKEDIFYEHTEIKDENGNVLETIKGVPALKYFKREVDSAWKTKKIEGVTVDNKGRWLPKTLEQRTIKENLPVTVGNYTFTPDYINTAYEDLKNNKPDMFNLLEALKRQHLGIQKDIENKDKLGLRIPRYRKALLERTQAGGKGLINDVKSYFQHSKDQYETGMNYEAIKEEGHAELFANELSEVPITGLYKIDPDQVSLDVIAGTLKYMASAERQKKLLELSPLAQAMRTILKDPDGGIKKMMEFTKEGKINRVIKWVSNNKQESIRAKAIDNQIKKTFEGQHNEGMLKDSKAINQISSMMFKSASAALFSLNIPSALKNSFSAMFQNMILSAAGKDSSLKTYHQGVAWSAKASIEISSQLYTRDVKSRDVQLIDVFTALPMRQEHTIHEVMSRTLFKDTVNFSWMISPRRFTEINATLGLFGSMMYHQKVPQIINGKEQLISYMDAFELKNGQITLKAGIDPTWAPGGDKFHVFKANYDAHTSDLNGGFTEFDQPEATRHLVFRMIAYMRRYFVTMFQNRWGAHRLSVGHSAMSEGYYITNLKALKNTVTTLVKHGQWYGKFATPMEKTAALKMAAEAAQLVLISMISSMFFGWSPDDKEKYAKLRKKSGPLPLLGVRDTDNSFDPFGWTSNHTLLLTQNVFNENAQWITPQGYLHNMLDFKSVALGPTLNLYAKITNDLFQMAIGNDNAYYKKEVGPYDWQDKESAKVLNHVGHVFGLTGGTVDPALAIKNLQAITSKN